MERNRDSVKVIRHRSMKMNAIGIFLLFASILGGCTSDRANPLKDPHICGRPNCDIENSKFAYAQNIRYNYDYTSHVRTEFRGTGQNASNVYVTGTASLTFPTKCEGILKLADIELREWPLEAAFDSSTELKIHKDSQNFSYDIQKFDLRFSFHDGIIDELCPDKDEPNWVMNFKRGILSSFQNSMQRFDIDAKAHETDISGACDVTYTVAGVKDTNLLVHKKKDLPTCVNRYKTNSILQTVPYDFRKQFSVLPILQSSSYCNITIDHKVYQETICTESHVFAPFSNNGTGAVATTSIKLSLLSEDQYTLQETPSHDEEHTIKKREKLLFNHYPTPKHTTGEIFKARELLKQMCQYGFPDIKRKFIDVYSKFLQNARLLSSKALHQLFQRADSVCDSEHGRNHILESLPYIGSTASVEMMTQEIIGKTVGNDTAYKWLTSMSFLPRPDEQMLQALYTIIKGDTIDADPIIILAPTAVVHTFCRNHDGCQENEHVLKYVDYLEGRIMAYMKRELSTRANREKVIVLLRGLGNIGIMSKLFRAVAREYILDDRLSIELRVNTIAMHRRSQCEKNRDFFLDVYRNVSMNSELRIATYLEAIRCPDYLTIKYIKYVLQSEEVNQVGSFVWSHLKNVAKSASPARVAAQGLLVDDDLGQKFNIDIRKFSRNYEHSLFFDEYNFGVTSDANLIFGTDSYIPRSASYNFTMDLFGESVNMFEVSAYLQGFEHLVEGVFGPHGPLSTKGFTDKLEATKQFVKDRIATYKSGMDKLRIRRDVEESGSNDGDIELMENDDPLPQMEKKHDHKYAEDMKENVKKLNYDINYNMNNPRASFGVKMFGNDLRYKSIEDLQEIYLFLHNLNPMNQVKQLLSGKEVIYTKSGVFLEASYEIPLVSGFPLALQAHGASSIDLRAAGSLKGDRFWQNPKFAINGKLKPSVSVDIIGTMQSDYFYGSSGIRVKNNLYSSSSIEANLTVDGSNSVSLQIGLPQDRNDIVSARSELIVIQHEKEIRQPGIDKRYANSTCTWPGIERAIGLKVCSNYSLPDVSKSERPLPSLLFCGPVDIQLYVDKMDVTAKIYSFDYNWVDSETTSTGSFIFNTPESNISRIFGVNVTKEPNIYSLNMQFKNGDTEHSARAVYKNTEDEKLIEANLRIDGQRSFALETGMNKSMILNGWLYYPKFILSVNNDQIARLSGSIKELGKNKITQYEPNLEFVTKKFQSQLSGYVTVTENKISTRVFVNYKFENSTEELIDFESEYNEYQEGYKTNRFAMVKWNSTAYQKYNFKANFTVKRVLSHIEFDMNINNAVDFVDPKHNLGLKITFIRVEHDEKDFNTETNFIVEVTRPISKINYKFMFRYNSKLKRGTLHNVLLLFRHAEGKESTIVISAMLPSGDHHDVDLYLNVAIPDFNPCTARFQATQRTREQRKQYQYDVLIHGVWFTGHSIDVYGTYDDKSTTTEARRQLKLVAKSPHFNETTILVRYTMNDTIMVVETNVEYGGQPYGLLVRHGHVSLYEQSIYVEFKKLDKLYWISARLSDENARKLSIDLHIDRIREIRLIIGGQSTPSKKEIEMKLSWDSNRDPTQELFLNVDFNVPHRRYYDGGFTVSYPQRTFSGSFDLAVPGPTYKGNVSIGWRSNESIHLSFDSGALSEPKKQVWLDVRLNTPFDNWRKNVFSTQMAQAKYMLSSNTTILWADTQKLVLAVLTDYEMDDEQLKAEARLLVNSTVKEVPTIDALFKHHQDKRHYITDVSLYHKAYNESINQFAINSNWHLNSNSVYRNITGSIQLKSPLKGYTKGSLATKFSLSSAKKLLGAADFELEEKKFTLAVDGMVKKITDCMLVVNITTPIAKYRNIINRFGLVNRNRHLVAEIRAPTGALGVEVKFAVNTMNDFDVIFNLETPIENFKKIMLIAKLNAEMADFRGGLNKSVLGYVGVSRRVAFDDFEYSWKVYTPLEKFEESSLVVKFIRKQIFDMELMLNFAQKKLGIIVNGKPKQKIIGLPRVPHSVHFKSNLADDYDRFYPYFTVEVDDSEEVTEENNDGDDGEPYVVGSDWNLAGQMELSTIIWPTISGFLDVEDIDDEYYIARANLNLPQGNIEISNHLYYPDYMRIRNSVQVITPFIAVKEIEMLYFHSVKLSHYYLSGLEVFYKNDTKWNELGFNSNYTKVKDADLRTHDIEINLLLPFEILPHVLLGCNVELADTTYKANITGRTKNSFTSLAATLEKDINFVDLKTTLALASPALPHYEFKVYIKQDLSDTENIMIFGFDEDYRHKSFARLETTWRTEASYLEFNSKTKTNLFPTTSLETAFTLNRTANFAVSMDLKVDSLSRHGVLFHISGKRRGQRLFFEMSTPIESLTNVTMSAMIQRRTQPDEFSVTGRLTRNRDIYNVNGTLQIQSNIPHNIELVLTPVTPGRIARVAYSLDTNIAEKTAKLRLSEDDAFFDVRSATKMYSKVNWNTETEISASPGILSKRPNGNHCTFNAFAKTDSNGKILTELNIISPWRSYGFDAFHLNGSAEITPEYGSMHLMHDFSLGHGRTIFSWTFVMLENMQTLLDFYSESEAGTRSIKVGMKYTNPGKTNQQLDFGGNLDVDSKLNLETNCTAMIVTKSDVSGAFSIRLPPPINDIHRFSGKYNGNVMVSPIRNVQLETRYESVKGGQRFLSRAQYRNVSDLKTLVLAQWGTEVVNKTFESNFQMLRKGVRREISAKVKTPYYEEETFKAGGSYDRENGFHIVNASLNFPADRTIASTNIEYLSLANVKGYINCSTPFPNVTWLRTDFNYSTYGGASRRYIKTAWPRDFAFFDMSGEFESRNLDRNHKGIIAMEVPLTTRHKANIEYELNEHETLTTGHCNVLYNDNKVVDGEYKRRSESKAGFSKEITNILLDNSYYPAGITYIHQYQYIDKENPFFDMKRAELYELRNATRFNITGELHVQSSETGQAYKIVAIHPNRTVIVTSDYDYKDTTLNQRSKLLLATDMWIGYDFKLTNHTTNTNDSQSFSFDLQYPKRNLSTRGWYAITDDVFDSDMAFKWTKAKEKIQVEENLYDDYGQSSNEYDDNDNNGSAQVEERVVSAAITWRNEPLGPHDKINQSVLIVIKHPSFRKDVEFNANYYRNDIDLVHGKIIFDYHDSPEHLLTLEAGLRNSTELMQHRNYTIYAIGSHPESEWDLYALASLASQAYVYQTKNFGRYKRGYLPLQEGLLNAGIDLPQNDIHYRKMSPHKEFYMWVRANGEYPSYTMNGTYEDSPDINTTGTFYVNFDNRFIRLDANFTPDATQNLQMLGIIPDARSAKFHLWRDYEDIRIVDIAYFLRMNHSRLITSELIWRPKLKEEINNGIRKLGGDVYDSVSENVDFWVKTLYTESVESFNDVRKAARPFLQEFEDDINGLAVIGEDLEDFRKFLGTLYEANDFYIKTTVNFTLTVLDELAIRNHIGSLPKIMSEIWQVFGESAQALRKSILWLIETVKTSYKNVVDGLHRIFHGEAMNYLSSFVEKAMYKYDRIIKDLHLSFIKYVQNIWNNISNVMLNYWRSFLERIQPMVMRLIHYSETLLWNVSQEILDYLHKHTNDLVKSPYFDTVSGFMRDLDTIYRDLQGNDAITSIKKYSALASAFLREKYFKVVPFGRELEKLIDELIDEIKQLRKQELVHFLIVRVDEWRAKLAWLADEFQLDRRMHKLWQIILNKAMTYDQTALRMDDKYREAKTKFVFDPNVGVLQLEQKLPMAWHAFNETPIFEEISELQTISKVFRFFNRVNVSWIHFDAILQYYTNSYVWLPPFKSRSLLIGSRHFVTFDKRFISLNHSYALLKDTEPDQCSYLLANDFIDSNFTLTQIPSTISYNNQSLTTRKLSIRIENHVIDIDLVGGSITIDHDLATALPVQIANTIVYREWDILVIRSENGFELNCNLQFDFCWFELSGWYFGKTAGIMGTPNNEIYDDFITTKHTIAKDIVEFKESWAIDQCQHDRQSKQTNLITQELVLLCDTYFRSKVSEFADCFGSVDSTPFYDLCLDMGSNSITDFTHSYHPAQKGVCAVAMAYMESCAQRNLPLRVPDICLHCNLLNGSYVAEGSFFNLAAADVPKTTEVVFIVEAKPCNQDLLTTKNIPTLIAAMEKAFNDIGLKQNRYAVIAFGGEAPFENAHSIVHNNDIFTDSSRIKFHFNHIKTGKGNSSDISRAIKLAAELVYRPGASKTLILMPCSPCNASGMHFENSIVLPFLWENNINLHILMNGNFETKKERNGQKIFGFDATHAYTNNLKELAGNKDLHSEIIPPNKVLGSCMSWATGTNGTIFSVNKLHSNAQNPIKKFTKVFARRVARTAIPSDCQNCECTGENNGIAYVTCSRCDFGTSNDGEDGNMMFDDIDYLD